MLFLHVPSGVHTLIRGERGRSVDGHAGNADYYQYGVGADSGRYYSGGKIYRDGG